MSSNASLTLCLDWTPNTNHSGFFIAQEEGLFAAAGLDVTIRTPDDPACKGLTPARQVAAGLADFAITPSETAISFATTDAGKPALVAVAALLQGSTSSIAVLADSGIESMKGM